MTTPVYSWFGGTPTQDVELEVKKKSTPLTHAAEIPADKDINAVHITSKQQLIALLHELNKNTEIKKQLLEQLSENDEVCHTAKELLTEDLTASTLIIADDEKGDAWLSQKKEEYEKQNKEGWFPEKKPEPSWKYHHIVTKPARAIWWTGKTVYQVWNIASAILVPVGVAVTIAQSPWTKILFYLAKKIVN